MEALEKHYAENVQVWEMPTGEQRDGRAAQIEAMKEWFGSIKEHHGGGCTAVTANEEAQTTCIESWTDITMQNGHRMKMSEIGIQKWKDGKIVEEKFYYNMPGH